MSQIDREEAKGTTARIVPTFVGVGPPKCATTWLDDVLRKHPHLFLPKAQKEVFYFDRFFDRGNEWYKRLFDDAQGFDAVGEISTSYILDRETIQRIYDYNPDMKIVCILRHPVHRLVSHYRMFVENGRTTGTFEEALGEQPVLGDCSAYKVLLENVLAVFPREQLHLAIYEEIFHNSESQKDYIASLLDFLGVPDAKPMPVAPDRRVRVTYGKPKSLWLVKKAKAVRSYLRRNDMEALVNLASRVGIERRLFLSKSDQPNISQETYQRIGHEFEVDVAYVEDVLGRRIDAWIK